MLIAKQKLKNVEKNVSVADSDPNRAAQSQKIAELHDSWKQRASWLTANIKK